MNKLTPLHTTGLYIIEVPENSLTHYVASGGFELWYSLPDYTILQLPEIIKGNFSGMQILGPITSDTISFDPAPYLEKHEVVQFVQGGDSDLVTRYKNYLQPIFSIQDFYTPEESLYTLLNSCAY